MHDTVYIHLPKYIKNSMGVNRDLKHQQNFLTERKHNPSSSMALLTFRPLHLFSVQIV